VEEGFAEVDEDVYAKNKDVYAKNKEVDAKDKEDLYVKDEEMYAKESEEMYARNEEVYASDKEGYAKDKSEEIYARNEEVYAKAKESCFCWPAPSGPSSQSKSSRQMSKEKKSLHGSKNQLNKAAGGTLESGASCWSDSFSVWGSDFPGTIRSHLGQPDSEGVNLVAIHAYQGGEPGTITLTSGEQLRLVGKEESGWVRVKRLNSEEEGYVPASYTSLSTTTRL